MIIDNWEPSTFYFANRSDTGREVKPPSVPKLDWAAQDDVADDDEYLNQDSFPQDDVEADYENTLFESKNHRDTSLYANTQFVWSMRSVGKGLVDVHFFKRRKYVRSSGWLNWENREFNQQIHTVICRSCLLIHRWSYCCSLYQGSGSLPGMNPLLDLILSLIWTFLYL